MQLIDTHQHLILRGHLAYAWADAIPALADRDFTPADHAALTLGRGLVGSVFMETGVDDADYRAEARLIAGMVGQGGLMGQIASCRPESDEGFDAWLEEAEALHVLGFRRILHVMPDDLSTSTTFRANLRKIGRKGLPFDLCVFARQHGLAEALLRACPDQVFVLDHCGNPDIAAGAFGPWAESLRRLAAFSNLHVKLSGITVNCGDLPVTEALLKPYVDHVIDCFGPSRILWGSDWPVVEIRSSLPDWISLTHALLAGLSPAERAEIGHGTARRVYGLPG
jgi:predicted TIM-barrel fold metal-dependent hydrolase